MRNNMFLLLVQDIVALSSSHLQNVSCYKILKLLCKHLFYSSNVAKDNHVFYTNSRHFRHRNRFRLLRFAVKRGSMGWMLPICLFSRLLFITRSLAVTEKPRDVLCLSAVSFNSTIPRSYSFIISYFGFRFTTANAHK